MTITYKAKKVFKLAFPRLTELLSQKKQQQANRQIVQILSRPDPPQHYDSDNVFEELQNAYDPVPEYGYDSFSTWQRGVQRAKSILTKNEVLRRSGLNVLDAACGDGMTGYAFKSYGYNVELVDFEDWREPRAANISFTCANLSKPLPYNSDFFDLICSFNAFEHIDDPGVCFKELLRICKPGGHIYLEFGPLYNSPWGLHAYRTLWMPYPQFIFSEEFITKKLKKLGINDLGQKKISLQPLNKWRVKQFQKLWDCPDCTVLWTSNITVTSYLQTIKKHDKAFSGRDLKFEDVTIQGLLCMMTKNLQ